MARTLRVSALQLAAHDRDAFSQRIDAIEQSVDRAAASSDLLVLPESTFPAYVLGDSAIDDTAVAAALEGLTRIAIARNCVIVAGLAQRRDGELFNTALVIDRDGSVAGRADKAFLWHFDRKWFAAGRAIAPVRTSVGTLGVLVCADGRMPAIARALVDQGAELLVMPTAWVTSGRDPEALENIQADLLARVRAFENGTPFVAANKCGIERSMVAYCGKSQIVAADGTMLALACERNETTLTEVVELRQTQPYRSAPVDVEITAATQAARSVRVAISIDPLPADIAARLSVLDAEVALAPGASHALDTLSALAPLVALDAHTAFDPGALITLRSRGARVVTLDAAQSHPWLARIARARALELRIYVIVFDREARRAYAVDPDGVIVAGTFGDYTLASFALDVRKTSETALAPGTDVAAGIDYIATLVTETTVP